jgi:tetratricopeptide (TPR) repeat protein
MADSRDPLQALAGATAKKKSAASARQQIAARQVELARQHRVRWMAGSLVVLLLAAGAVVIFILMRSTEPAPPPVVAEEPLPGQSQQRREAQAAWDRVRTREPTPAYKPLLDRGGELLQTMDQAWSVGQYSESAAAMDALLQMIKTIESLDRAREASLIARQDATAMGDLARQQQAESLVPVLMEQAREAFDSAAQQFKSDAFEEAGERWRAAGEVYGQAAVAAQKAAEAQEARRAFEERLVSRFERSMIDAWGRQPLAEAAALVQAGERHAAEYRFEEAREKFEQAAALVPRIELEVRRQTGAHYFAVLAGYRAADVLLARAMDEDPGEARWNDLRQTLENLQMPGPIIDRLLAGPHDSYLSLARLVLEEAWAAVAETRGTPVADSFAVGVQVRLIEKMLDTDADAFARQEAAEIRRSAAILSRRAESAGYGPALAPLLKEFGDALSLRPEFAAIRKSREIWTGLIRELADYDTAMKILPPSTP